MFELTPYPPAHRRLFASALDDVALPVARHAVVIDRMRAHVRAEHLGNLPASISPALARDARTAAVTQAGNELAAQFATRLRTDGRVDGLLRDRLVGVVGSHAIGYVGDLLGATTPNPARSAPCPTDHVADRD